MGPGLVRGNGGAARRVRGVVISSPRTRRHVTASLALALLTPTLACSDSPTALPPDGAVDLAAPWEVALPGDVGLDGSMLDMAAARAEGIDRFQSLVVVRRGRLVLERYWEDLSASTLADVRSVTKSVVSTLTGAALARGHLRSVDQPIGEVLAPPAFQLTTDQAAITIGDLASMTGGFAWGDESEGAYNEWIVAPDHVAFLLDRVVVTEPGSEFHYNSAAVHLLGVILEEATGHPLPVFADQVLFAPLGIGAREWEALPGGRVNGGAGLDLRPRDLARLGQLALQEGWSGDRRLIPAEWFREATARRFPWAAEVGPLGRVSYGLLWWTDLDREAFFAWGYGGQFVYVAPAEEIVVVTTTRWQGITADTGPRPLEEAALEVILSVLEAVQ